MAVIREHLLFWHEILSDCDFETPAITKMTEKLRIDFSVKDYFALAGKSLKDLKRGNSSPRDEFPCVEETIKLIFRLHGQVYAHSITPTDDAQGWMTLMRVKQIRNQLTHPKCAADLEITYEQGRDAIIVFLWMQSYLQRIQERESAKQMTIYEDLLKDDNISEHPG